MGRSDYLIDTNIIIYYFGNALSRESEKYLDEILVGNYFISVINQIELLSLKKIDENELKALTTFIANAYIFDLAENIVETTIQIRKNYNIKLPDAIIAATCVAKDCSLITNNKRDFERIDGLRIIQLP